MQGGHPWQQADIMSKDQAIKVIDSNIDALTIEHIRFLGEGWDNTSWLVNHHWVFRLPKHEVAAKLVQSEVSVLGLLPDLSLQIPKPEFICYEPQHFAYPFFGHQFIVGQTADRCQLSDAERIELAVPIACFLKQLHTVSTEQAKATGVGYDQIGRLRIPALVEKFEHRLAYLRQHALIASAQSYLNFFLEHQVIETPDEWVLAHGDFYAAHIVLDEQKQLSGVIDWGDSELIHPAIDLAIAYYFLPSKGRDLFWQAYGPVSDTTKLLAKIRATYHAVSMAWYAHQVSNQPLLKEMLDGLERMREIFS